MVDERLLRRLDLLLLVLSAWLLLSLVLASFALMAVDVALGVLALGTVVLVSVVGVLSYLRTGSEDPDVRAEVE